MYIFNSNCRRYREPKDYTGVFIVIFFLSALFSLMAFFIALIALCK